MNQPHVVFVRQRKQNPQISSVHRTLSEKIVLEHFILNLAFTRDRTKEETFVYTQFLFEVDKLFLFPGAQP